MKRRKPKGPGQNTRMGLTVKQLFEIIPDEATAEKWIEGILWGWDKRNCGHCSATDTVETKSGKPMKYRCRTCGKYFNIRTGTFLQGTHIALDDWIYAIYLMMTNLKGVSSMKVHRELGITQKSAWHMMHRIRNSMNVVPANTFQFSGEV